jgi:Protein of unknown function (DUF664)
MDVPADMTHDGVGAAYRGDVRQERRDRARLPRPGLVVTIPNPGEDVRLPPRVIVIHLIEETGRHAGHADILREQIYGSTAL